MVGAVRSSVQSLFDAYVAMLNGATVEEIGSAGSTYFEALKYIPVFIDSDPGQHFTGMYASYAGAADEISGSSLLPVDWIGCKIQYVWGALSEDDLDVHSDPCSSFPVTSIDEQSSSRPVLFSLNQNYPNPFNPSTKIKYSIPESGFVKLSVYNLVGEELTVLVNKEVSAGIYEVIFNAANLPSGTYFYRLQTSNSVQTKKMVLLK